MGTAFRSGIDKNTPEIIHFAVDRGKNLIDTAELYFKGRAETMIGEIIKKRRDKVVIVKASGSHLRTKQIFDAAKNSV